MDNQVVWVDIPVRDLDRAIRFYSAVLDAAVTRQGGDNFVFGLLPHSDTHVGGCLYVPDQDNAPSQTGMLIYLNATGRLKQASEAVVSQGGQVIQPLHPIGTHGFRVIAMDTEGNRFALHAPTDQ